MEVYNFSENYFSHIKKNKKLMSRDAHGFFCFKNFLENKKILTPSNTHTFDFSFLRFFGKRKKWNQSSSDFLKLRELVVFLSLHFVIFLKQPRKHWFYYLVKLQLGQ